MNFFGRVRLRSIVGAPWSLRSGKKNPVQGLKGKTGIEWRETIGQIAFPRERENIKDQLLQSFKFIILLYPQSK